MPSLLHQLAPPARVGASAFLLALVAGCGGADPGAGTCTAAEDACGSAADGGDTADTGLDTGETVPPSWGETPLSGNPRESWCWGILLWDGQPDHGDYLAQLVLPVTRDDGEAAADFSAEGSFPGTAELVVVEGSSVREEALLDTEGCSFDTDDPVSYADPGTWWSGTAGSVVLEATYVSSSPGGCGEDSVFELAMDLAGVSLRSAAGDSFSVPDSSWSGLFAGYPACPPE